jgi:hypothetical protein
LVANDFGVIDMDAASVGDEWNSGEELTVTVIDQDLNKNTLSNEDLLLVNTTNTHLVNASSLKRESEETESLFLSIQSGG